MPPASDAPEQKFYPPPPSWFSKYISPWLIFLLVSGLLLAGWLPGAHSVGGHMGFALGEALIVYLLVIVLTDSSVTCLTVGPAHVTKEQSGTTHTLAYTAVKGFSEHTSKQGTYTLLEALPGAGGNIVVEAEYAGYLKIRALLAKHVPDLDAPERTRHLLARAQATDKLLQDTKLGPTTHARRTALRQGQKFTLWLNVAALLVAGWLVFYPHPLELVAGLGLLIPLVAVGALWGRQGLMQFMPNTDDPHADMLTAITAPTLGLLLHVVLDNQFITWHPLWSAAASAGLVFGALLLLGNRRGLAQSTRRLVVLAVALVLAAGYGLAAATVYNVAGGGQHTERYLAHVTSRDISQGKRTHYYLFLNPWGPANTPEVVSVSKAYYARKQPGDTLYMRLQRGHLGADWASVAGPE